MKSVIFFCSLLLGANLSIGQSKTAVMPVNIKWVTSVKGDFSFVKKWSYPEGVERNEYGQLSCDGFCPQEVYAMIDSTGKIIRDSLAAFYKIVDTSHQLHSIECKAWCYEWAGTDFIEAIHKTADTVYCYTLLNAATHCSLQINIVGNSCFASIDLNSIVNGGSAKYNCTNGYITIDKILWEKGIVKAVFSFNFEHKENPKKPIYWKGKIFTKMLNLNQGN
jgi:hypothetical protein